VVDPHPVADIHATLLALGIDGQRESTTSQGRPIRLSEGQPIRQLLTDT